MAIDDKTTGPETGKYTSIDAVVNVKGGVGLGASSLIVKECMKYDREIYLVNSDGFMSGKRVIDMISLGAAEGDTIRILVEGNDETAEEIALRLYSALTSKERYNLDFDRFAKKDRFGVSYNPETGNVEAVIGFIVKESPKALDSLYSMIGAVQGSVELLSEEGVKWSYRDGKSLLKRYFSRQGETFRLKFEGKQSQLEQYGALFETRPEFEIVYPTKRMLEEL